MANDSEKESKSIGRNIFSERGGSFQQKTEKTQIPVSSDESSNKSIGRNIFSETGKPKQSDQPRDLGDDLKIIEKRPGGVADTKKESSSSSSKARVNALHVTQESVVFAQTQYDGSRYRLTNLQVIPIEIPAMSEEEMLAKKEDDRPQTIKRLQYEAVDKVFTRAGVSKKDPLIVSSLNGEKIIVKQSYIQNVPAELIELNLPNYIKSPFGDNTSRYEFLSLNSDGMNHDVLAAIVDNSLFFGTQSFLQTAGIECKILDIDKMAVVNLYHESVKPPFGTISCVIDIGNDVSTILIIPNGKEELYIRNIDFTYNQFRKMLQKNRDISMAETEEMIKNRNFYDYITTAFEAETTENLNQHYGVKKYVIIQLMRELQKTFSYYSQQNQNKTPSKIYVTGRALEMNKFSQFINKNTDIPCEPLDAAGFFLADSGIMEYAKEKESVAYVALGLALRYE
jgi:Tfp pilus assembly PilM family ATPase